MISINNKVLLILTTITVLVVAGTVLFLSISHNQNTNTKLKTEDTTQTQGNLNTQPTILVTSNGFEPKTLTVKVGNQVVWINKTNTAVTVNSDTYPYNLLWPFLNLGSFDKEHSVSVVFKNPGNYTYHNQLNSSQTGTIKVK